MHAIRYLFHICLKKPGLYPSRSKTRINRQAHLFCFNSCAIG
ncbi:MAG: zinc-finger domain-containing protein [Anaerolineaceae bacterium]|nr:zinc-finger domain-containing protein [Anaerolineaceae bacterium]